MFITKTKSCSLTKVCCIKNSVVIDIIHESGGLCFLAHPYEYNFPDVISFIDELRNIVKIDGVECFHPSSELENKSLLLIKYARDNNLFISGGSDYHRDKKLNNDIGIGDGTLNINKEYIEEWAEYINN